MRQLSAVQDLELFQRFVRLCAGRVGQLLNLQSLANDVGILQPAALLGADNENHIATHPLRGNLYF